MFVSLAARHLVWVPALLTRADIQAFFGDGLQGYNLFTNSIETLDTGKTLAVFFLSDIMDQLKTDPRSQQNAQESTTTDTSNRDFEAAHASATRARTRLVRTPGR